MATVKHHKVVAALPADLEPDALYLVRSGAGFDLYATNHSGLIAAYPLNVGAPGQGFFRTEPITATTAGQTVFTVPGGYTPGAVIVSLNGASLPPADYTAADGATVVLASGDGIVAGSVLLVYALSAFEVAVGGGGGELAYFEETRSAGGPNATVPAHGLLAVGDEDNIDFVIAPKGTGAVSASVPDGTAVGGNKRGAGAVDLQMYRSGASAVASGVRSVAMGGANTASGNNSVAIGWANNASGGYCVAIGSNNTANGSTTFATGNYTNTRNTFGAVSEGYSSFGARQQMRRIPLSFDTTDAISTQLSAGGGAANIVTVAVLPNNSTYYCRLRVVARDTATNTSKSWHGTALIKRGANAAATALVGSTITSDYGDAAMSACTVALTADTTLGSLAVTVTGLSGSTIRWVAQLETVEAA